MNFNCDFMKKMVVLFRLGVLQCQIKSHSYNNNMSRRSARLNNQKQQKKQPGYLSENESKSPSKQMIASNTESQHQSGGEPNAIPLKNAEEKFTKLKELKPKLKQVMPAGPPSKFASFEKIIEGVLNQIQLLDYQQPLTQVKQKFKSLVKNYVVFDGIFPTGLNLMGKELLKNGIFHEMWGKICKKAHQEHEFVRYYQKYQPQLIINHTNFENAFNQQSFSKEQTNFICLIEEEESLTRLTQTPQSLQANNSKPKEIKGGLEREADRLKIISVAQSNQTRMRAEMVCYFLGIRLAFHWVELEQPTVLEFNHDEDKALMVVQAHVPLFNKQLQKKVISLTPQTLVAMHGYVSFAELLRVKEQYEQIRGFIIIEELASIKNLV